MQKITANKTEVLSTIIENRKNHSEIYDEALGGYKRQALRKLQDYINDVANDKIDNISFSLPRPLNYLSSYNTAIKMLELEVSDKVQLDEEDVQQYVLDDWHWKRNFLTSNSLYSAKAADLL